MIKSECKVYILNGMPVLCKHVIARADPTVGVDSSYIYGCELYWLKSSDTTVPSNVKDQLTDKDEKNIEDQRWRGYKEYCDESGKMRFEDYHPDTYLRFYYVGR